jgi:hypothetical protein
MSMPDRLNGTSQVKTGIFYRWRSSRLKNPVILQPDGKGENWMSV